MKAAIECPLLAELTFFRSQEFFQVGSYFRLHPELFPMHLCLSLQVLLAELVSKLKTRLLFVNEKWFLHLKLKIRSICNRLHAKVKTHWNAYATPLMYSLSLKKLV